MPVCSDVQQQIEDFYDAVGTISNLNPVARALVRWMGSRVICAYVQQTDVNANKHKEISDWSNNISNPSNHNEPPTPSVLGFAIQAAINHQDMSDTAGTTGSLDAEALGRIATLVLDRTQSQKPNPNPTPHQDLQTLADCLKHYGWELRK